MELNRSGKWSAAATHALGQVDDPDIPDEKRCEAYVSLVYAEIRLNRLTEARGHASDFDRECSGLAAWLDSGMAALREELQPRQPAAMRSVDDGWEVAGNPAAAGLREHVLVAHEVLCELSGADACVLVYRGQLVQEWYGPAYREPAFAMSSTKSVTGLLAGMLVDDGKLTLDVPVSHYVPQWTSSAGVKVRHLLTMTSGLPQLRDEGVGTATDKEAYVFSLRTAYPPGSRWAYSNEGVFLLSPLLDAAAGEPIEDYAERRLFTPLGLSNTRLHVYPAGQAWTHADMETTARDLARIGLLMLQRGRWGDAQLVPASWIEASTNPSQELKPDYGLLWWLYRDPAGFGARGRFDTNLYVFPELELVAVRMQSRQVADAEPYEPTALALFRSLRAEASAPPRPSPTKPAP
jgi:hypothetical protein